MIYKRFVKRAMDAAFAAIAFVVLAPVFLIISIAIRIFDKGPVLFSQERVGFGGATFILFKFRTMPVNTGDLPSDKIGTVKIGGLGRFLRRTNLDELPQLINIMRGDMSLIGPRPQLPSQKDLLGLRMENGVFAIRPGLTGWAQVNSFDNMSIKEKTIFDTEYVSKIGVFFDILILFRTIGYVFRPPPVY